MRLTRSEFEEAGQNLQKGQRIRIEHHCGEGKPLLVSRGTEGIRAWCFRCGASGFIQDERSLAERIAALTEANEADTASIQELVLPGPGVMDASLWPNDARLWLYKAGFSDTHIKALGFYWNPKMQRVILPVKLNGELIYWQGRGFDPARPKAINPAVNREGLVAKYGSGDWIALTEDILSAAKVGSVGEAWALLGTVLSNSTAMALAETHRPVLLMLDDDAAGRRGAAAASKTLSLLGVWHKQVYFGKDPKLIPRSTIKAKAQEVLT